jgi:polysaccharide pyruvyl transferase WcaK-like protein
MKIAIFGWYGHDNAGDERIKFCLDHFLRSLGGISQVDFFDLHEHAIKGATNQFDNYNLVIIGGGGLIFSQHNYHDFIMGIRTTIITAGISVETKLIGNPKKFAMALLEKSKAFLVRDSGSFNKLKEFDATGKVKISSDLTFLEPYDVVDTSHEKYIGVNLLSKTIHAPLLHKIFLFLSQIHPIFNPRIIDFSRLIDTLKRSYDLLPIPLYCVKQDPEILPHNMNDIHLLKKYFNDIPNTFRHEDLNKCYLFFSMRLHGLIFAIQKGIPALSLSIYPKQTNFMMDLGLEECLVNPYALEKASSSIEYTVRNKNIVLEKILHYRDKSIQLIRNDLSKILSDIKE